MATATHSALDEALAARFAADLIHGALLEAGEPVKASEAARLADREDVDLRLARVILATHPDRFTSSDRKWTLWTRFAGPERALERNLEEVIVKFGLPATVPVLAREMAAIYDRPVEIYERSLPRILSNRERYFPAGKETYGLVKWLLDTSGETADDVMFDNYLKTPDIAKFEKAAKKLDPTKLETVVSFLDEVGEPVPNKTLQFLVWRANPHRFHADAIFASLLAGGSAVYLSDGTWIGPKSVAVLIKLLPAIAEKEVDEYGESKQAEASEPLTISEEEREQLIEDILKSEASAHASRLLEDVFEVTPGESTYEGDLKILVDTLKADERIVWVGSDRFLPMGAIPEYVYTVPEILHFPVTRYTDPEGNEVDLLLEDDGFDGGLQREVLSSLSQDVLDEEPAYLPDPNPPATQRCVLKFHHKEIGTLALSQLAPGFFPVDAPVIQLDMILPTGQKIDAWVNNETRLVYGLLDWYQTLPVDSGAVFYLERQKPDRFAITYGEETEPAMFISRNRVNELIELGHRSEEQELPTFDILQAIMEHYRKGIEYITLLTEVNIARRTTRRMIASLLSSYHCFFQRGGAWVYDAKKLSQGFDRSKRKYLKK